MAKRGKRTKRRSTASRRGRRTTKRSSSASRGVVVTMSVSELKKLLKTQKRQTGKKQKKSSRRRSSIDEVLDLFEARYGGTPSKKVHQRPPGTDVSASTCLACNSMMYEKDEGPYTHYYCPSCDKWTKAIRAGA